MTRVKTKGEIKRRKFIDRNHNLILSLYPDTKKIYGPFLGKDARYRVVLYQRNLSKISRQYAKIKMEIKLERRIEEPETVDHINRNTKNDRYDNLQVLDKVEHSRKDSLKLSTVKQQCVWCQTSFMSKPQPTRPNKAGPFCSKVCSGKYGAAKQNGRTEFLKKTYKREYYR